MKKTFLLILIATSFNSFSIQSLCAQQSRTLSPMAALAVAWIFDMTELEALTGGFVTRTPEGICAVEKRFEMAEKELRLQGMAHIAGQDFYKKIKESLENKQAIMLMEGVTDEKDLLETPPDYEGIADNLGLASQRDHFSPAEMPENVEVIRADLDTSDFKPQTIEILNFLGKVYAKDGINFSNLLMMYLKMSDIETARAFLGDLISRRNLCLIEHIRDSLGKTRLIVVPWGAMHLPQIEKWALKEGFALKTVKKHLVVRFPDYFKFILQPPETGKNAVSPSGKTISELLGI